MRACVRVQDSDTCILFTASLNIRIVVLAYANLVTDVAREISTVVSQIFVFG